MIADDYSSPNSTGEVGKNYSAERTAGHRSRTRRRKKRVDLSEYEVPLVLQGAMPGGSNIPAPGPVVARPSTPPSPDPTRSTSAQPISESTQLTQEQVEDDDDCESTISLGSD